MRLFIGIGVPRAAGERLGTAARNLLPPPGDPGPLIRWSSPGNMHVTISFLGQVDPARLEQIQQRLSGLRCRRLEVELSGAGVLANARLLVARLKPSPALLTLAEQIVSTMEECGFAREQRPYLPHVTLARSKGRIRLGGSGEGNPAFWQVFQASEFRLYASVTRPGGAEYQVLRCFPLQ
jgi:2'-5' RNA ligase